MNYVAIVLAVALAIVGAKAYNGMKAAAAQHVTAVAEKQIAESVAEQNKDIERETARILAARTPRVEAMKAEVVKRKAANANQVKIDKPYRDWASQPVPDYVIDRLHVGAGTDGGVRPNASNDKPVAPVQASSAKAPATWSTKPGTGRVYLGPARRN